MKLTPRNVTASLLTFAALLASACNTVEGVGKDLESAGDKAQEVTEN